MTTNTNVTTPATTPTAMPSTGFQAGQRVRLTAPFTGRCMTYQDNGGVFDPKPPRVLATGTVLTVFVNPTPTDKRLTNRCRKADPAAVLVCDAAGGKWCIPTSMLEAVSNEPQGKEPTGDCEGGRVG